MRKPTRLPGQGGTGQGAERLPPGQLLSDLGILALAAWTLLCHLVVAFGGNLRHLHLALLWIALASVLVLAAPGSRFPRRAIAWLYRADRGTAPSAQNQSSTKAEGPDRDGLNGSGLLRSEWLHLLPPVVLVLIAPFLPLQIAWLLALVYLALQSLRAGLHSRRKDADRPAPAAAQGNRGRWSRALFWLLAISAATYTASFQKPDLDDAYYLNVAVAAADHPERQLFCCDTLHDHAEAIPDPAARLRTFELLPALLAYLTGIAPIHWSHRVLPPLLALLVVACQARLMRRLVPERWLGATAVVVLILALVGDGSAGYSQLAFLRLHQGKAVLATAVLPMIWVYGLGLGTRPGPGNLLRLSLALIAAMGLNPSALWLAPSAAGLAVLAGMPWTGRALRALAWAAPAPLYLLWIAWGLRGKVAEVLEVSLREEQSQDLLRTAVQQVLGEGRLLPAAVALASLLAWRFCSPGPARRFCLVLALGFLVFFFSPYSARVVGLGATGVYTYWRVFWLLPAPAFLALLITAPMAWPALSHRTVPRALVGLLAAACFLALIPNRLLPADRPGTVFAPFALRVTADYEPARLLAQAAAPGSRVVAPYPVSPWVVTFPRHPFPMIVRAQYLRRYLGAVESFRRQRMTAFVSGRSDRPQDLQYFLRDLEATGSTGVCVRRRHALLEPLQAELQERKFTLAAETARYQVWILHQADQTPQM